LVGFLFYQCRKNEIKDAFIEAQVCLQSRINDSLTLKTNLVGEWELIYAERCGFCPKDQKNRGSVIFEKNKGVLTIQFEGEPTTISAFDWTVEPTISIDGTSTYYTLKTEPFLSPLIFLEEICKDYMISDSRANDGGYYLFKKL
jgi:hypothetical protein